MFIRRSRFFSDLLSFAIFFGLLTTATLSVLAGDRPNVLMILVDDLRPSLGCYGDPIAKSPSIDRLAASSRLFRRAYCHQSVCGPSRASILTGRLPDHTGVWHNRNRFRSVIPDLVTLPQLFKNSGYTTIGLGKVFSGDRREDDADSWSRPSTLRLPGWKNYAIAKSIESTDEGRQEGKGNPTEKGDLPDDAYADGRLADLAVQSLRSLAAEPQPFFLAVGFFKPHLPFCAPEKYWDLYDAASFAPRAEASDPFEGRRTDGAPDVAYPDHLELAGYASIPQDERVSPQQAGELRHGYYACISYTDAQVGKLLDAFDQLRLGRNTIVILLGDHGYSLGEAGHWCKDTNFETDTHVPLMIRVPGMTQPGVPTDSLVEYVDLYPTLASLAGLALPDHLDGQSLGPILNDPAAKLHEHVLSQFSRPFAAGNPKVMGYSIRTNAHRYTRWIDWRDRSVLAEELYDYGSPTSVRQDGPWLVERLNLIDKPEARPLRDELRIRLDQTLQDRVRPVTLNDPSPRRKKNRP